MTSKVEDWLFKCRQCKHYYQVQKDVDEVRCQLKCCRFEPTCEVKEFHELQDKLRAIGRK